MISRPAAPRWAFWALAFALLLKAAVPLLAAASAQAQGRALIEVCTVYGIATVDVGTEDGRHDLPAGGHAGGHCVLGAVVALGAPVAAAMAAVLPRAPEVGAAAPLAADAPAAPDPDAAWAARLRHAPPAHG